MKKNKYIKAVEWTKAGTGFIGAWLFCMVIALFFPIIYFLAIKGIKEEEKNATIHKS